jgi:hypothetical protein
MRSASWTRRKKLTGKRYKWLNQNYPDKSAWIASTKDRINSSAAQANIISGDNTFRLAADHSAASAPFFDVEDEYFVKADLWLISSVAITLMDFFFGVVGDVARTGQSVIDFRPDFQHTIQGLASENENSCLLYVPEKYLSVLSQIELRYCLPLPLILRQRVLSFVHDAPPS